MHIGAEKRGGTAKGKGAGAPLSRCFNWVF